MLSSRAIEAARLQTAETLAQAGIALTEAERATIEVADFGLSELETTGLQLVVYVNTREIALKDVTVVGILSASPGLAGAIASFASGAVVPDAIVSEVVSLEDVPSRLEGHRGVNAAPGPKVHVDPRI